MTSRAKDAVDRASAYLRRPALPKLSRWLAALLATLAGAAAAEVAMFDQATGLVRIPTVAVGAANYVDVVLKHQGNLVFTLQSATQTLATLGQGGSSYDGNSGVLNIPDVLVGCTNFVNVALLNIGNFTFTVQAATAKTAPVSAALAITAQPVNANIAAGQVASFTVEAGGTGPFGYQWQRNGAAIPGATAASYTTPALSFADNGALYAVVVRNAGGSMASANATVAVSTGPLGPGISVEPVSFTAVSVGSTPTLLPVVSGFFPNYQWRRNGVAIAGATARIYTLPPVTADDDGAWYSMLACNTSGCVTTLNAQLQLAKTGMSAATKMLAGPIVSLAVRADGSLWGWGQALGGTLSLARQSAAIANQGHPSQAMCATTTPFTEATLMAAGSNHTLVARRDGTLWATGGSARGQRGDGSTAPRTELVPVLAAPGVLFQGVRSIAAGVDTSHAVSTDGAAWAWGGNQYHQLGDGTLLDRYHPVQVKNTNGSAFTGVATVSAGTIHTLWLKSDGSVWAAGFNTRRQLGDGSSVDSRANPVQVRVASGLPLTGVTAIAAGATHNLALLADGTAVAWGTDSAGALANQGSTTQQGFAAPVRDASGLIIRNIVAIEAGGGTSHFLLADGSVLAAGAVAIGNVNSQFNPALVRDTTGGVFNNVRSISSQGGHALAIRNDGSVWGWGSNSSMTLADGSTTSRSAPVRVQGMAP